MLQVLLTVYNVDSNNGQLTPFAEYDITDNLIESDFTIDKRVSLEDAFSFVASYTTLNLVRNNNPAFQYFTKEMLKLKKLGIQIIKNSTPRFWGRVDKTVYYDYIKDEYTINVVDWYKWLYDEMGQFPIPFISESITAENLLSIFFNTILGNAFVSGVQFFPGATPYRFPPQVYNDLAKNYDGSDPTQSPYKEPMTIKMFIMEIQKHYGSYIYFSPDKNLILINCASYSANSSIDITNDVLESDGGEKELKRLEYEESKYKAILVNGDSNHGFPKRARKEYYNLVDFLLGDLHWAGYAFMWLYDDSQIMYVIDTYAYFEKALRDYKYLDLREKFRWSGSEYTHDSNSVRLEAKTPMEWINDYKIVMMDANKYFCSVDRIDLNLFNKVDFDGKTNLQITRIKESLYHDTSELELTELPADKT